MRSYFIVLSFLAYSCFAQANNNAEEIAANSHTTNIHQRSNKIIIITNNDNQEDEIEAENDATCVMEEEKKLDLPNILHKETAQEKNEFPSNNPVSEDPLPINKNEPEINFHIKIQNYPYNVPTQTIEPSKKEPVKKIEINCDSTCDIEEDCPCNLPSINTCAPCEETKIVEKDPCCCEPTPPPVECRPKLMNGPGLFAEIDFLYLQLYEGRSLEYAFIKDFPVFQRETSISDGLVGQAKRAKFDMKPAFSAKLGYQMQHDNWKLSGNYTYFKTDGSNKTVVTDAESKQSGEVQINVMRSVFPGKNAVSGVETNQIISNIKYTQNNAIIKLEKQLAASPFLFFTFAGGVEGAWLKQKWKLFLDFIPTEYTNHRINWKCRGAGPYVSINSDWYMIKNLALFFNTDLSVLICRHDSHLQTNASSGTTNDLFQKISPSDNRLIPHTQLCTGLKAHFPFRCSCYMDITAGYQFQGWFNVHEVYHYFDNGNNNVGADANYAIATDPIYIHGLMVGLHIHF